MRILLKKSEIDRLVNTGETETYIKIPVDADRIIRVGCDEMVGFPDVEYEDRQINVNMCTVETKTIRNLFANPDWRLLHAVCKRRRKHGVMEARSKVISCVVTVDPESNLAYWKINLERCE